MAKYLLICLALLVSEQAFSQLPIHNHSATSSAWTPASDPNLKQWWKADAITGVTSGNPITTWPASFGTTLNLVSSPSPNWVSGVQNGLPAVESASAEYAGVNSISAISQPLTVYLVFAVKTLGTFDHICLSADVNFQVNITSAGAINVTDNNGGSTATSGNIITDTNFHILMLSCRGDGSVIYKLDGGSETTMSGNASTGNAVTGFYVHTGATGVPIWYGEIAIANVDESVTSGNSLATSYFAYLRSRWATY